MRSPLYNCFDEQNVLYDAVVYSQKLKEHIAYTQHIVGGAAAAAAAVTFLSSPEVWGSGLGVSCFRLSVNKQIAAEIYGLLCVCVSAFVFHTFIV